MTFPLRERVEVAMREAQRTGKRTSFKKEGDGGGGDAGAAGPTASAVHVNGPAWKRPMPRRKRKSKKAGPYIVRKAHTVPKVTPPTKLERVFVRDMKAATRKLGKLNPDRVDEAILRRNASIALDSLDWSGYESAMTKALETNLGRGFAHGGAGQAREFNRSKREIVKAKKKRNNLYRLNFKMTNPRSVEWIRAQAAASLKAVADDTKLAVRKVIEDAYSGGIAPKLSGKLISEAIGEPALFPAWQQAVVAYSERLATQGIAEEQAATMVESYRDGLIDARGFMIARTETIGAQNAGRVESWQQAAEQGYINPSYVKQWLIAPDEKACPICIELNGTQAALDGGTFDTEEGDEYPPAHPNCRCTVLLVSAQGETILGDEEEVA